MYALGPGQNQERDLSWFDFSIAADMSQRRQDRSLLRTRRNGRSPLPQLLAWHRWMSRRPLERRTLRGAQPRCSASDLHYSGRPIERGPHQNRAGQGTDPRPYNPWTLREWFPDEKQIVFLGQEPGRGPRIYVQDVNGGAPRAITPEGAGLNFRVSPDGTRLAVAMGTDFEKGGVSGQRRRSASSLRAIERGRSTGGCGIPTAASCMCYRMGSVPADIFQGGASQLERRTLWRRFTPPDPVGVTFLSNIFFSADMKSYVYSINRRLDVLYLVEGLR